MTMTIDEALNQAEAMSAGLNWILLSQYEVRAEYASPEVSIDLDNRVIGDLSENVSTEGENNAEYISFIMDRYHDGVDLSNMLIQIQYELEDGSGSIDGVVNAYMNDDQIKFGWVVPPAAAQVDAVIKIMVFCTGTLGAKTYTLKTLPMEYTIHSTLETGGSIPQPDENWYLQFANTMQQNVLAAKESADAAAQSASDASDDLADIKVVQSDVNSSKSTVQTLTAQVQSNTTKAQASADAAKVSEQNAAKSEANAKMYADNASAVTGVQIATQDIAGIIKGGENYIGEDGTLHLTTQTTEKTLPNSYAGGIKINSIAGRSEQDSTTGAQLLNLSTENALVINPDNTIITSTSLFAIVDVTDIDYVYISGDFSLLDSSMIRVGLCKEYPKVGNTELRAQWKEEGSKDVSDYNYLLLTFPRVNDSMAFEVLIKSFMLNIGTEVLPWEPYTGGVSSPSPDYPQEIKCVKGKNLLDCRGLKTQISNGVTFTPVYDGNGNLQYIEANGTANANIYHRLTTLNVSDGNYILSGCPSGGGKTTYALYVAPSTSNSILDCGSGVNVGIDNNTNTYSVNIAVYSGAVCDHLRFYPMIRKESVKDSTYVPYGLLRVKSVGKNLASINSSGNNVLIGNIEAGKSYTLCFVQDTATGYGLRYGSNGTGIVLHTMSQGTNAIATFTSKKDAVLFFNGWTGAANQRDFMLVEGIYEEFIPYEPYQESVIALSEPIELHGIGDVTDRIVQKDGMWGVERENVEITINGTEAVSGFGNSSSWGISAYDADVLVNGSISAITGAYSERFIEDTPDNLWVGKKDNTFAISTDNTAIRLYSSLFTTANSVKEYFASNPTKFVVKRAKAVFEPLPTADQIALHSLKSFDGTTHFSVDSEIEPVIDLEYGTSRVGGYTLESWNTAKRNEIEITAMKVAQTTTEEVTE